MMAPARGSSVALADVYGTTGETIGALNDAVTRFAD